MNMMTNWLSTPLFLLGGSSAGGEGGSSSMPMIFIGLIFVVFYFFMIRPQNTKRKQREAMLKALEKGDKIVTIGGIHGSVTKASEDTVVVKVDDGTKIEFNRSAIAEVVNDKANPSAKSSKEGKIAAAPLEVKAEESNEKKEGEAE